ncbi:hypothetical protein NDU88_004958 [Pleurodeles waltl]|uniref:peptidylprolyl isomerase n=1 Tax=Pleurodeles waltl TaxID=8319 RepID=A0AAV7W6G4_PLEWA|nr:hypothetical protein NDU88_004958 [Pleurodeles waltl]
MASGGSRQRKTRWDDSRARERDDPPVPAPPPPPPPEPGGADNALSSTDSGRQQSEVRGETETHSQQEEPRAPIEQHIRGNTPSEQWGQQMDTKPPQELWGSRGQNVASQEPWGPQGENRTPQQPWIPVPPEPWVAPGVGRGVVEPWIPPGVGRAGSEPWIAPGESGGATETWALPAVNSGATEPWVPPGASRGAAETWVQPAVGRGAAEHWVPPGVGRGVSEPWVPPGVGRGATEPWVPPAVGRGTAEPWLPPGVGRGSGEPWLPPGANRIPAEPWVPPGDGRGAAGHWAPPGLGIGGAEPWPPRGVGRGAVEPWVSPGTGRGVTEPWVPPGVGRGTGEPWVPPGIGRGSAEQWVPPGVGRGSAETWAPPGMGRGSAETWAPTGAGRGATMPSGQQPDSSGPGQPGLGGSQESWGQHAENRAFQEQPTWGSQEPWGQQGQNVVSQEQQVWTPQEPWRQQDDGRWRASQEQWGQHGQDRPLRESRGQERHGRGRGPREPWGQQWDGRDQGSQKPWKQHGDGRERGSSGPWGSQGEGRGRGAREQWSHQGEGRERGSHTPRRNQGEGRGRGSRVPWGHQGEGRGRGTRVPWAQQGQNRGSQEPWRQFEEGRGRGSQKPWGHQGDGRDRRAHEPWGQQWDGSERGSHDAWGQQDLSKDRGLQEPWNQQENDRDRVSTDHWGGQQDEDGKISTEIWGQHAERREMELAEPWGQQQAEVREGVLREPWGQQARVEDTGLHESIRHPGEGGRERVSQGETTEGASKEPILQQADDSVRSEGHIWQKAENRVASSEELMGQHGMLHEPVGQQAGMQELVGPQVESIEKSLEGPLRHKGDNTDRWLEEHMLKQEDAKELGGSHESLGKHVGMELELQEAVAQQGGDKETPGKSLVQLGESGEKVPAEHVVQHDGRNEESEELMGQPEESRERGSVASVEPYDEKPVYQLGDSRERGPGDAAKQHNESIEERSEHYTISEDGSRAGLSKELAGYREHTEKGSEEQMGQHEKNQESILEESIGQAESDAERGSEEPMRYHEERRDKVLEVAKDQHGRDKYESSEKSMRRHEESREMTPKETMGQHESDRNKRPESPVGHHEESKVCDSEEDTVSQRPVEELMEQYEEDQRRALQEPMERNKKDRERELQESVGWYKEAGEKVSPEPVGQHGHHVGGVLQEFVGQQVEVTEMLAQGPAKLQIEDVKLLQEAHGQHHSRDGSTLSHQEEVGQRDNKEKVVQRGEFVEVAPYIKENMEAEERGSGEEALQWRKSLQQPAGTSEEKVCSKESRENQDCREIDIKELKAESGIAVSEVNNEKIVHEQREPQKDSKPRSTEKGTILEDDLCDTDIKSMTAKKEIEFGVSAGIKQRWQRSSDEDPGTQEERKHRSREIEKTFTEEEVCEAVLKAEIKKEEEDYNAQSEMRHKRQKAYEDDHLDNRERKQSRRETEKSFVDKADDGGNVKEMAVEDPEKNHARADIKQRQRMYEEDKGDYEDRKNRGREKERTFKEDEVGGSEVNLWDCGKTEEEGGKRQMGHWTGRKVDEKKELEGEDGRKATEGKHLSSRKKERKREEREDGGRERKHRGRERRDKQDDEATGERKYGSSRKKRRREKSWDEEEEEEEDADGHDAGGERKHRSRERRREKQQAGGGGDVQHWPECLGENEDLDREQWGFSQEMETHDEGADIAEEMIYWSGQGREQHNESVGEVEWRHERSRKERKREQHEQETGSERKHWESRERHRRRDEAEDDEGCGAEEPKSSRKKEKRREHDNSGERKHRSSRKKQKRREEEELRGGGLKQWSDSEKERGKDWLGAWEMEDGGENKPRSDGQQRRVLEEDGEETEIKLGSCRQVAKKEEEEDEVEKFLSVMEMERSRKKSETQHHNTERSQGSGGEKERKPERSVKEHGEKKYDARREKDGTKEDNTECKYIYMEVDGDKMQTDDSGEGTICTPVEKEGTKEKAEVSGDVGRLSLHSRDRRREKFSAEGILTEVEPKAGSEGRKKEAEMYSEGEEKHTLDFVARIREPDVHIRAEMKHGSSQDEKKRELEVGCGGESKHVPFMERDKQLEGYGEEVEHLSGKGERKRAHREDGQVKPGFGMGEWKSVPLEMGGEVKHASMVEMERESRQSDGDSLARSTSDVGKERKREKSVESAQRIKEPLSTLPFDDGGERLDQEREVMRDLLLASAPLEEEGGGNQERNMEQQMSCLSSTEDGSVREQRRELQRSWDSSKDVVGNQEIKGELLLSLPPSKEDGAGCVSKEKMEQLSQTPAKRGRVRKKDQLSSPFSKEENTGGEGNEKKEELMSLPSSKEADSEERWVGPLPTEASQTKKRKVLEFERVYLDNLPSAAMYERSYMHRDVITHVACTKTDFIITASHDGHVKFWKKIAEGIEFVKHFRSHLGVIECIAVSSEGALFCSIGEDQAMKVFDVVNFDMINMLKLGYHPGQCEWLFCPGDAISAVASSEKSTGKIFIYDGRGSNKPMYVFERLHSSPLTHIRLNSIYKVVVSADKTGMIEYWTGPPQEYKFPKNVHWEYKTDTDLYEFAKCKAYLTSMCFSPDGKKLATIGSDRKVRIFRFLTGKLMRVFDESLSMFTELQQMRQQLPDMEFGRRMAVERELEKVDAIRLINIIFDETGHFVLYGTMLGIKVINVETNRCVRILGKQENVRILQLAMFQGVARKHRAATTVEMKASDNPVLMSVQADPTIVCTAFKKNRFYLFSKREPEDTKSADSDRDVFNEKPSKEEVMAATQAEGPKRVSDSAIVHTSMGDVHIKLFPVECPKTVENFCVHSRNGYYNGHTFHRIIKGFMVQTGDPSGTGMGGESIWGGEFEDEFHPTLRHDRPYTLSMANAGPNSNGSQFFLTVVPTPWLDNKHTVFGRVTKGMEVVQRISNVKVNPKTDKPYEDISIISITVK